MDTESERLGELASGLKMWTDAVGEEDVKAGRVYH